MTRITITLQSRQRLLLVVLAGEEAPEVDVIDTDGEPVPPSLPPAASHPVPHLQLVREAA